MGRFLMKIWKNPKGRLSVMLVGIVVLAVMYLGEVMESGATAEMFAHPAVPYTSALMSAIPEVHPTGNRERIILSGEARSPINPPDRCRFVSRCPNACEICRSALLPPMTNVGNDHIARCHLIGKEGSL